MKWKRSKKAAIEAKKGQENNNNNKEQHKEPSKDGNNIPNNKVKESELPLEHLNNNHDVSDDMDEDDDIDMDESDIDEDDVIDVADEKQQTISHQCVNPFMEQSRFVNRDIPTDLSMRPGPTSLANNLQQSQHVMSLV